MLLPEARKWGVGGVELVVDAALGLIGAEEEEEPLMVAPTPTLPP